MARSAGSRIPDGLARRSRRVLAAALITAAALVLPAAISGANGDGPDAAGKAKPQNPAEALKKQAELDRKIAHVQDEAAHKQAEIDERAQKLAEETARKQAYLDAKAQKLADEAARKRAQLDARAQALQLPASGQSSQPATAAAPAQPTQLRTAPPVVPASPPATQTPAQSSQGSTPPGLARRTIHQVAEIAHKRAGLERHIAHKEDELEGRRTSLADHVADEQAELDSRRARVGDWLARRLGDLLSQRLSFVTTGEAVRIPPAEWQPAPGSGNVAQSAPSAVAPQPTVTPAPAAGTPTPPPVIAPNGEIPPAAGDGGQKAPTPATATPEPPAAGAAPAPAAASPGAVVAEPGGKNRGRSRGGSGKGGGEETPAAVNKRRTPVAVVLHPLARAVAEIPRTVWVGMSGLGIIALALALVTVLQSRRALKLAAAQRALRADMATLSSAVMPAVPAMLGGLALSVASRPANGPASGGDFHDAFELTDGRAAVVVGDVAGDGRDAVAATVLVRHTLRAYLEAGLEPRAALATAGAVLADRHEGLLATAVVAVHDRYRETLTLASAGHVPPIVMGGMGHRPVAVAWPPPLGAGVPTGRRQTTLPLPPGTTVCLFTDGATEARLGEGRVGPGELTTWLRELGPEATAGEMLAYLRKRADDIDDDVTICVLRSTGEDGAAPAELVEELAVTPGEGPTLIRFLIACGVSPARAAELAVSLEQAPERATLVAEVRIGERSAQARLRPARPAMPTAFAAA